MCVIINRSEKCLYLLSRGENEVGQSISQPVISSIFSFLFFFFNILASIIVLTNLRSDRHFLIGFSTLATP